MRKSFIFYHKSDLDGKCSGAIALDHFVFMGRINSAYKDFNLYPIDYYDPLPLDEMGENSALYFLDIFPQPYEERYESLLEAGVLPENIIVCDHHKTFLDSPVAGKVGGNSSIEFSGCELTYMFFNRVGYDKVPSWIRKLGRYDVWDKYSGFSWEKEILPFQYGARDLLGDSIGSAWDLFWRYTPEQVKDLEKQIESDGLKILKTEERVNKELMENFSFEAVFDGINVLACNTNKMSSNTFKSKYDKEKHDAMMPFLFTKDGKIKVSLYTEKEDLDVSEIAKRNGGGGHRKASGFMTDREEFFSKLEIK